MILTGPKIREEVGAGNIICDPYDPTKAGPNSLDLNLHPTLQMYKSEQAYHKRWNQWNLNHFLCEQRATADGEKYNHSADLDAPRRGYGDFLDMSKENTTTPLEIPKVDGMMLWPGILYLGRTVERVGSKQYVPWCDGRSSIGRLGIHVHVTAGRGDTGWFGTYTLELHVVAPVRVYVGTKAICQVSFFDTLGDIEEYEGRYQDQLDATGSRIHDDTFDRTA